MKAKNKDLITQNKIFGWIAIATGFILMIPLIMTQVSEEWDWQLNDFIVIGALIFGMGSLFVLTARKVRKHRLLLAIAFAIALLYFYAELAVGIFTNLGS